MERQKTSQAQQFPAEGLKPNVIDFVSGTAQAVRLNRDQRSRLPKGSRPTAMF